MEAATKWPHRFAVMGCLRLDEPKSKDPLATWMSLNQLCKGQPKNGAASTTFGISDLRLVVGVAL